MTDQISPKPWHRHYDAGVPHSLKPYPAVTLVDIVAEAAAETPDKPALFFKGSIISYGLLERHGNAVASALLASGVKRGERVALLMPNSPQMIVAELGIWKAGAIAVPLNPLFSEHELTYALNECAAGTVIVLTPFYRKVKAVQPHTAVHRVVAVNIKEYLPPLKKVLFTLLKERKGGHRAALETGDLLFSRMLQGHEGSTKSFPGPAPGDPALFLFTGGTGGLPKCAVSTHNAMVMTGMQIYTWLGSAFEKGRDVFILNMPLFHAYAQVGVMATGFVGGQPLALLVNPRDIGDFLDTVRRLKPSLLAAVPTFYKALFAYPGMKGSRHSLGCLKVCVSSASPLPAGLRAQVEDLTGGRFINAYSLTEATVATVIEPLSGTKKEGAAGVPCIDVEVRILDQDDGCTPRSAGEHGEVVIRAPQLMKEYWNRAEATAEAIRDGWLYTGDIGYLDGDGYLFIVDRKKDIIKPGGLQVWPGEVEAVLCDHPLVHEAGVAGVPDDYQGEAVKAWVVLNEGARLTEEELQAFCRGELLHYKVPKHIEFVESLPKSAIGKLLRRKLNGQETVSSPPT
jgi:long-chain acyl-CoA synthetase